MKKCRFRTGIAVILTLLLLTGCGDIPDLSEGQSNMIAEYAGGVLLRYSKQYDFRLVENDFDGDGVEDAKSAVSGPAASATEEEPTQAPDSTEPEQTPDTDEADASAEPEATEEPSVSLDELYNIKGLHFTYNSASFTYRYPKDSDTVQITPDDGQVLYVVSFNIQNTSKKAVKVDLTTRPFHYELNIGGETILPSISLLPNGGLNYLMTTIKAGKTEEAVLIFNLDESKNGTKGNVLSITEGDRTTKIDL